MSGKGKAAETAKPKAKAKAKEPKAKAKAEAKRLQPGDMESDGPLAKATFLHFGLAWACCTVQAVLTCKRAQTCWRLQMSGNRLAYPVLPLQEDREDGFLAETLVFLRLSLVPSGSMTFRACCSTRNS